MPSPNEVVDSDQAAREAMTSSLASTLAALITMNRVADARALLAAAPEDLRSSSGLRAWTTALAEPSIKPTAALSASIDADLEWIRQHAADYAGRWVAIRAGDLLASTDSLRELLTIVDQSGGRTGVLIHEL